VRVLPWVALTFVQALFMVGLAVVAMGRLGGLPMWVGSALQGILGVAIHLGFIRVSLRQVRANAREYVAGTHPGKRGGRRPWRLPTGRPWGPIAPKGQAHAPDRAG